MFSTFFRDSQFPFNEQSFARVKEIIRTALELGINYFDVAPWYGIAQDFLAIGLESVPRDKYYLATKIGRYNSDKSEQHWFDYSYKRTIESVEESLKLFKCDYIDLIQVISVFYFFMF